MDDGIDNTHDSWLGHGKKKKLKHRLLFVHPALPLVNNRIVYWSIPHDAPTLKDDEAAAAAPSGQGRHGLELHRRRFKDEPGARGMPLGTRRRSTPTSSRTARSAPARPAGRVRRHVHAAPAPSKSATSCACAGCAPCCRRRAREGPPTGFNSFPAGHFAKKGCIGAAQRAPRLVRARQYIKLEMRAAFKYILERRLHGRPLLRFGRPPQQDQLRSPKIKAVPSPPWANSRRARAEPRRVAGRQAAQGGRAAPRKASTAEGVPGPSGRAVVDVVVARGGALALVVSVMGSVQRPALRA